LSQILVSIVGTYTNASIYRLNGSDFGMILPNVTVKEAESMAQNIHARLNEYMRVGDLSAVASMGIVAYGNGKPLGELLASADTAISLAQTKHVNAWHIHKDSNLSNNNATAFGNQNWRSLIEEVVNNNNVTIMVQPIQASNRGSKAYAEILARFKGADEQILPTASFLAMAEKLNRVIEIDRLIVEKVLDTIKTKKMADQFFGINLTPASVHNDQFMIWLERRLLKETSIATKLIFEVTEFGLQQNVNSSRRFIDMIHRAGARITVEKFGVGITSFKFFQELKPDFIKLDGSYPRNIEEEKNNQYFIRMIVDLSHRIGVNVLAECVETQEEKHVLEKLMVDGCQGYYLGKPEAI
jgi:EAL domain-containing protein (putative c-di-GMP-specific phosphodiesterase class I)